MVYQPEGCPYCGADTFHRLRFPFIRWTLILAPIGFCLVILMAILLDGTDPDRPPSLDLSVLIVALLISTVLLGSWLLWLLVAGRRRGR